MQSKRLFEYIVCLIFLIFLGNFFANKLYWYYSIWWFDMPMHFLGGLWLGLLFLYFFSPKVISLKAILKVLFFVVLVGLGWELFESVFNNYIAQNPLNKLDVFSDILFDLSGGASAILYFHIRSVFSNQNAL